MTTMTPPHTYDGFATLTIDSSCDHRTHTAGAAAVLKLPDGNIHTTEETITTAKSSEAELHALQIGLELAAQHNIRHLVVYSNYQPVIDAINGHARFPKTRALRLKAQLGHFPDITGVHLPRHESPAALPARLARPSPPPTHHTRARRRRRGRNYHRNKRRRQTRGKNRRDKE